MRPWLRLSVVLLLLAVALTVDAQSTRPDNSTFTGNVTTVTPIGALFDNTPTNMVDGNIGAPVMDALRRLKIVCESGCTGSGTTAVDNSLFTGSVSSIVPIGALYDTTPPAVTDGNVGAPVMDIQRRLKIVCESGCGSGLQYAEETAHVSGTDQVTLAGAIRNDAGTALSANLTRSVLQLDSSGALRVTGGGGGTQYAEDTAHVSGDTLTLAGVVRNDAGTALGANGTRTVFQVDSSGALRVTGGGGGTQYVEESAHVSATDLLTLAGAIRNDAGTALGANLTRSVLQVDSTGALRVTGAGGGGGASVADRTGTFTPGTTQFTPIGGYRDDTGTDTLAEGNPGTARVTQARAIHVNLRDNTGSEVSVGGGTQYAEETASANGEQLTMAGVVRADSLTSTTASNGMRTPLKSDSLGALWSRPRWLTSTGNSLEDDSNFALRVSPVTVVTTQPKTAIMTREWSFTAAPSTALVTVSAGTKIRVGRIQVWCSKATTVNPMFRIGYHTTALPAESSSGADKIIASGQCQSDNVTSFHFPLSSLVEEGASNEDLRISGDAPTSGKMNVIVSWEELSS